MPTILIETIIHAPISRCFDLSRSIDLHKISAGHTAEEAVEGIITGLIGLNETVTWRARHFGIKYQLTSKITEFEAPYLFVDEMVSGPFKSFHHVHRFAETDGHTLMTDVFTYVSPYGKIGNLVDWAFLKNYMRTFLLSRNDFIKSYAESEDWKKVL
jgi:ligand-binding SRPBCC domain-containing protein